MLKYAKKCHAGPKCHSGTRKLQKGVMTHMNEMYHISADRQKRKYGYFSNFYYFLKTMFEWDKLLFFSQVLMIFPKVAASLLGTMLPARLVSSLESKGTILQVMLPLLVITLILTACNMLASAMENYGIEQSYYIQLAYMRKYVDKVMDTDYERLEDKEFKPIMENAWATARFGRGVSSAMGYLPTLFIAMVSVVVYGFLLARRSWLILILIMLSVGGSLYLLSMARKVHQKYYGKISKYAQGEEYISAQCMDQAAGKDIRIYQMLDFILEKYDQSLKQIGGFYGKIHTWYCFRNISNAVFEFIRDSLAYILLVYQLIHGEITAAEFVFYIGVIANFSVQFEWMVRELLEMNSINTSISYVREFQETESIWRKENGVGEERMNAFRKKGVKLELRDVTFTYQGNEKPTIQHLNLVIRPGEKLALIGLNGAGKTTLVKLICGLYMPEQGQILLNDIPMEQYTREEYFSLISTLFQETTLMPLSVDENITSSESYNEPRLREKLEQSGFAEKYAKLPAGGATKLIKKVEEQAVDFSGGEKQKLLFARALYKEAPLVILDEPTAALDPIAENELYENFGKAMENRTAIYISHRLSSTRFCDRIILLEGGQIVEEGTHDSLIAREGRYSQLYEMQSQYYKEQELQKQKSALMGDEYVIQEEGGAFHE